MNKRIAFKQRILPSVTFIFLAFIGFSSCQTCVSCKVERLNGVIEAEYYEYCGTEEEIEAFKADIRTKLDAIPNTETVQIICTEKE